MRKAFGPAFTMSAVKGLETYIDETIEMFVKTLTSNFVETGKRVGICLWLQYFAVSTDVFLGMVLDWHEMNCGSEKGFADREIV